MKLKFLGAAETVTGSRFLLDTGRAKLPVLRSVPGFEETAAAEVGPVSRAPRDVHAGGAEEVKIHGAYYPVKARTLMVDDISAHADYQELGEWLSALPRPPEKTFIVHGEPQSQDTFRRYLKDSLGWTAEIPGQGDQVILDD